MWASSWLRCAHDDHKIDSLALLRLMMRDVSLALDAVLASVHPEMRMKDAASPAPHPDLQMQQAMLMSCFAPDF
jgi:hypothetical protein